MTMLRSPYRRIADNVVVHYLPHQLLDHLLSNDPILLARQFCDWGPTVNLSLCNKQQRC